LVEQRIENPRVGGSLPPQATKSHNASAASRLRGAFTLQRLRIRTNFGTVLRVIEPVLTVKFFRNQGGTEPVRDWLMALNKADRKSIGEEIKAVQLGWPLGMPLVRKLGPNLWEIRVRLPNRIARVLFTLEGGVMVLLHGFIKKSQAIPKEDLDVARARLKQVRN
jgi:phage-related protein